MKPTQHNRTLGTMHSVRRSASKSGAICAGLLTGLVALPGLAAAEPSALSGAGSGLSAPAGVVQAPDGSIWVADPLAGICRLSSEGEPRLLTTRWCVPGQQEDLDPDIFDELAEPTGDQTTDVDRPVPAHVGPKEPSALALDPHTNLLYAADRASAGGAIWRFRLDDLTGEIGQGEIIATADDRVEAMTLGPALTGDSSRDLFFATKRDDGIIRIADPAGEDPQSTVAVPGVEANASAAMTAAGDSLYVADGGVTRYDLDVQPGERSVEEVRGFNGSTISAIVADEAHGRLYAGTSSTEAEDDEDVIKALDLSGGNVEDYELGFAGVSALGLATDGDLLVGDDPEVALGAESTQNEGRLWRVAYQPLNRPAVTITDGPAAVSSTSSASFSYSSRDGASFECRLDDGPFVACPGTGTGEQSYDDLAEGSHRFSIRAHDEVPGLVASRSFRLDRTAPTITIVQPTGDFVEGGWAPRIRFAVDEAGVSTECSIDDGPYRECYSGNPLDGLTAGTHVLRVVGTDEAGNRSDPDADGASVSVAVRARTLPATPSAPATGSAATPSPSPIPSVATPAAQDSIPVAEAKPRLRRLTVRAAGVFTSARARLEIRLRSAKRGDRLTLSIRNRRGQVLLTRTVKVSRSGAVSARLRLSRSERRRFKPGSYRVAGVLRSADGARSDMRIRDLRVARRQHR